MLRNWKAEFLENAGRAFDGSRQAKEARRKEADLKKTQAQMLKTIGQLTLERDFLQKTSELSIRRQCELLHIQRSKVYYKPAERSVDEQLRRESIMARIDH